MLLRTEEDTATAEQQPILVVEITSRSTRAEDLPRKPAEYAAAGVGRYWLVDRAQRTLMVIDHSSEAPEIVLELDDDKPRARSGWGSTASCRSTSRPC